MSTEDNKQSPLLSTVATPLTKYPSEAEADNSSLQEMIIGLRTVLDQTGTYIFTKDMAGRYTYVNQMTQDLFGASFEDIIGQDDSHFFDLELANELRINDRRIIDLGESIEREETNIVKATGEIRIYWSVKKPLHNDRGQIIGLCGISTDITERKAMENALRESETHLRLSQECGGIGTWEADLVNNEQKWSKNCTALLGFTEQTEPSWDNFLNFVHPEDRQQVLDATQSHTESGAPYDVEYRAMTATGSIRWLRSTGQIEHDAAGQPRIMRGVVQDVTECHQNQRCIEQLLIEQKAILENQLVGICTIRDRKIIWANSTYEAMFGYSKGELIGCSTRQLYLNEESYQSVGMAYAHINDNDIIRIEHEFVRKDGQYVWLDMSGAILHKENNELLWIVVDVTERKQIETQINKSLSLLSATLESTHDAILVVDLNNNWVLHNQRFLDLWAITDDLLVTKDDSTALSYVLNQLEDAEAFLDKVTSLYATPEISSFDRFKLKNGKLIDRHSIPQRIDGKVIGRVWSFQDITQQNLAEQALQKENEKNLALLHNASDGIHILDCNGNITEVSDSFCNMLGYQREEMIGMNLAQWDAEYAQAANLQFAKQPPLLFNTRHRRKDGALVDVEVSSVPLELDGKPLLFNSSRDITKRKQADESLQMMRFCVDHASDSIFWIDRAGRILYANNSSCKERGYSRKEMLSLHIFDLDPDYQAGIWEPHFEDLKRRLSITLETRHRRKDGVVYPIEVNANYVNIDGHEFNFCFLRDITARSLMETKLKASEKKFRSIIEISPVPMALNNAQSAITYLNPAFIQTFGYRIEDIPFLADWWLKAYPDPDYRNWVKITWQATIEHAEDRHKSLLPNEFTICTKEGSFKTVLVSASMIAGSDEHLVVLFDITQRKQAEQAFQDGEIHFRNTFEYAPIGIINLSPKGRFIAVNQTYCDLLGYTREQLLTMTVMDVTRPQDKIAHAQLIQRLLKGEISSICLEKQYVRKDHSLVFCSLSVRLNYHADGSPDYFIATIENISQRKKNEDKLRLAASVFTHAHEGIMITNPDGTIVDVNATFCHITGYTRDEVIGHNPSMLSSGRCNKDYYVAMWRDLIEKGYWHGEIWNKRKNGEVYAEMQKISAVYDAEGNTQQFVSLFSDITLIKNHEQELEHIAHYDALTHLPNRVLLADRLQQSMHQEKRRGQQLVVVFLDLDGFKVINDNHGHKVGDQLLMKVASHMKQTLREGDTLARLGGDEFVAVLTDLTDIKASIPLLTRLLAAAAQPVLIEDLVLQVSASLGATVYPQTEDIDADQLLRQADQAMYQAKLTGKNRYHLFDSALDNGIRVRQESLDRIRVALIEQEFVLHYQPKVNMRTGDIIGAEALIRWEHPEKGLLSPALFLPVIEDHPLAVELGEWVINTALTQIGLWHSQGLNIKISVNVGARQLQQADFAIRLSRILAAHPENISSYLEIEVLETSALEDIAKTSHLIETCRKMGVNFALDDFGTGYSSLTYLKRLPVTLLKIDQSFVHDMLEDPDDLAIIEAIVGLAHTFRRKVIAEGVETVEHGILLLQLGCEMAQGYGIARPMPADQLHNWSTTWRPDPAWVNQSSMSRDDLPMLFARIEQYSWIVAVEAFLKGEREAPFPQDPYQSRLSMWMSTESLASHTVDAINSLHQQIQILSTELCDLKILGKDSEALARLGELYDLRDAFIEHLTHQSGLPT